VTIELLTESQYDLLRGIVARAAEDEHQRVRRMKARPEGAHTPEKMAEAEKLSQDMAEIESALAGGR